MRIPVKIVCVTGALIIALTSVAWSEDPKYTDTDIEGQLCEIYSKLPVTKVIKVNHGNPEKIRPVVVHRCQELTFRVDRGAAVITITDPAITNANMQNIPESVGGSVMDTLVLFVAAEGAGASIVIPRDYPNPEKVVIVPYPTICFDPDVAEPYICEGTSPPKFIIPPTP